MNHEIKTEKILITGGTGMIGSALCEWLLKNSYQVCILTRNPEKAKKVAGVTYAQWDWQQGLIDREAVCSADHIIHLAGAGVVDKRWTHAYKKEILDSRVKSAELILRVLQQNPHQLKSILSCSATGWYGPDRNPGQPFTETDPPFDDFLASTCVAWEKVWQPAASMGIRLCMVRTGIVLSNTGGALREFVKPIQWRMAAILGKGEQMVSWIHLNDLCRIYLHLLKNDNFSGVFNAVAPNPVNNRKLTLTIARNFGKWFFTINIPAFVLKIMMGESSIEVLKSTNVSALKIASTGFIFKFPDIDSTIRDLLGKQD